MALKKPKLPGLIGGLGVTLKTMLKPAVTVQYPHEKEDPAPRAGASSRSRRRTARSACCAPAPAPTGASTSRATRRSGRRAREGGRERTVSVLDRFDIDYALCMYCGICVEVCPFDALFWSPDFEYSESNISQLLHDKVKLGEWMESVPTPEPLEIGAEVKGKK